MIEELKQSYNQLDLENQYKMIEEMLATKDFAVDKPFLEERISQTSFYLQQAIEELMKPKLKPQEVPRRTETHNLVLTSSSDLSGGLKTPQGVDKQIHFPQSSGKKPSILKASKVAAEMPEPDRGEKIAEKKVGNKQSEIAVRNHEMEEYCEKQEVYRLRQKEKLACVQQEVITHKSGKGLEPLEEVLEEVTRSVKSHSASEGGLSTPGCALNLERPSLDVFLNCQIPKPALLSMNSLCLGNSVTPTCAAFISDSDLVVGTAGSGILVTDFNVKCWIKLPNPSPIIAMKSLGRLVACCIDSPTDNLCLIDVEHSDDMMFLKGHSRGVTDVSWTDNAKHFVSVGKDGKLVFWKWDPLSQLKTLKVSNLPLNSVTSLYKSKLIVTGGDDSTIKVFSISGDTISFRSSIQDSAAITKVDSFYQNTKFVVSTNILGEIKIWDVTTGE